MCSFLVDARFFCLALSEVRKQVKIIFVLFQCHHPSSAWRPFWQKPSSPRGPRWPPFLLAGGFTCQPGAPSVGAEAETAGQHSAGLLLGQGLEGAIAMAPCFPEVPERVHVLLDSSEKDCSLLETLRVKTISLPLGLSGAGGEACSRPAG